MTDRCRIVACVHGLSRHAQILVGCYQSAGKRKGKDKGMGNTE